MRSIGRIINKFLGILSSHQKKRVLELGLLMLAGGLLETFSVSLILPFMDALMNSDTLLDKWYIKKLYKIFPFESTKEFMILMALFLALIYILKNAYLILEYHIQYKFVYNNMFLMEKKLHKAVIHKPYEYFLAADSGEVIRIVNSDTAGAFNLLVTLLSLFTELTVALMLVMTIFMITPFITINIAIVLLILVFWINRKIKPVLRKAGLDSQRSSAGMNKWLLQSVQGIKEIKVSNTEEFFVKNYSKNGEMYVNSVRKYQILSVMPRFIIEAFSMAAMFFVIAFIIYLGKDIESIIPVLTAVAMAAIRLLPSVNRISISLAQISYNEPMLDKMIENLREFDIEEDLKDKSGLAVNDSPVLNRDIQVKGIYFSYPHTNSNILTNASMQINYGESVGIVGASGAGKTTVADIILGLLKPEEGAVFVDGIDIERNLTDWRKQIGYIPQTIFMLDDTIKANVAFGEPDRDVSADRVWKALADAELDEFVKSLPGGIDTRIGEMGIRLSGGQKQRIGIARALYHDPNILVFDEATSALDNETEAEIMKSIYQLKGSKTIIIIAHRLSTINKCDHVFKVENETITEV